MRQYAALFERLKLHTFETAESGVDKVVSSCKKNPSVLKAYTNFLRQRKTALDAPLHAVSSGRSMIEMLGVLAIIGVLSVGGIAGYSKAMETYKLNKLKNEYSYYIFGMLDYIEEAKRLTKPNTTNIVGMMEFATALNLIPESWHGSTDSMGNYFVPFSRNTHLTFDLYIGWQKKDENNVMVSASYSDKFCSAILTDVIQPLHYSLYRVSMVLGKNVHYYGDNFCTDERLCLIDLKPDTIQNLCKTCLKDKHPCYIVLEF